MGLARIVQNETKADGLVVRITGPRDWAQHVGPWPYAQHDGADFLAAHRHPVTHRVRWRVLLVDHGRDPA